MILFIDACARQDSRTRELASELLNKLTDTAAKDEPATKGDLSEPIETIHLYEEALPKLTEELIEWRTVKAAEGDFSDDYFRFARQFQKADKIIVAAPFWDLSFPAILKQYFEHVSIVGLTFKYSEDGRPVGLCSAEKLYYVTTSGGPLICPEFGFGYVKALTEGLFGVKECRLIKADGLDIWGNDPARILQDAKEAIHTPSPKKLTIFVDMDGTIEQLLNAWLPRLNAKYHRNVTVDDIHDWNICLAYEGLSKEDIMAPTFDDAIWSEVQPMPYAAEVLQRLKAKGHRVYIVTATAYQSLRAKMDDLLFRCFPFLTWNDVIIMRDKQLLMGDVMIDDAVHNLEGGHYKKLLFDAPYNQTYDAEANGMTRVKGWLEAEKIITEMENV